MDTTRKTIIKTAITSRLVLITLQYLSNLVIPDHNADVFIYPKLNTTVTQAEKVVEHLLGGFIRWDGQYFMHVALYGYTFENTLAFFPFYPVLGRVLAEFLGVFLGDFFGLNTILLVVFISINIVCFILASLALYDLSLLVLNKHFAFNATILFCFNPASVFFIAPYTECLFSYLTFKTMLNCILLFKKYSIRNSLQSTDVFSLIPISLSSFTRSNGVLNSGFLVYSLICLFLMRVKNNKWLTAVKFTIIIGFGLLFSILPFIIFQNWAFKQFCSNFPINFPEEITYYAQNNNLVLPGQFSKYHQSWCLKKVPLSYSYVQEHYWNVGFLKYYQFKQIPNFMLAFPIIYLVVVNSFKFFRQFPKDIDKVFCFNLFFTKVRSKTIFRPVLFVFIVHCFFLTLFCLFCVHIQVTTRMLCSSSPVPYWFAAFYFKNYKLGNVFKDLFKERLEVGKRLILAYFLGYFVVGTVMFCNFLPFT